MPEEIVETTQPVPPVETKSSDWPKVILAAVLGFGLLAGAAYTGYWYGTENAKVSTQNAKTTSVVSQPKLTLEPTPPPQQRGAADLKDIKYELPQGWKAKSVDWGLYIAPVSSGGFLSIRVYDYSEDVGRREYYCKLTNFCIEGTTYFTAMNIGNISGYVAHALDNSGGGPEYFGAKGDRFYIISSYNPPSPNEFEKNYRNVLNSLVF
jgi:hypothetical protein